MKLLIFQTGEPIHSDADSPRPMRLINVSNAFAKKGHVVHIISTSFSHQQKKHRNSPSFFKYSQSISYQLISSPGYRANIGLERFLDHFILAISLYKALRSLEFKPDAIFIGYPPIECALVAVLWAKYFRIPSFLDIKDSWPAMFADYVPPTYKWLVGLCTFPYSLMAQLSFRLADYIVTMSSSYLNWISRYSQRSLTESNSLILPLIPPSDASSSDDSTSLLCNYANAVLSNAPRSLPIFSFIGSLTASFDFTCLYKAVIELNKSHEFLFVIAGDGSERESIQRLFFDIPNVIFPGWLEYADVKLLLSNSICLVAPYRSIDNFTMNVPNKIVDSMAHKTTFLTSLGGEVRMLATEHNCGIACHDTPDSWRESMQLLIESPGLVEKLSSSSFKFYLENFTYDATYAKFVDYVSSVVQVR